MIFVALCFFSSYADSWSLMRRWAKPRRASNPCEWRGAAVRQVDAQMPENVDEHDCLASRAGWSIFKRMNNLSLEWCFISRLGGVRIQIGMAPP